MSVDQSATLKNADKLLAEGKLPEAIEEYVRLADYLYGEGFVQKASAIFRKALKVKGDHEHSLSRLYDIAVAQGTTADAKAYMRELVKLRNQRGDIVALAECLARLAKLPDDGAELRRTRELLGMVAEPPAQPSPAPVRPPAPVVDAVHLQSAVDERPPEEATVEAIDAPQDELNEAAATLHAQAPESQIPVAPEHGPDSRSLETVFGEMRSRTVHDRRALLYDLADALERRGERGRALEIFMEVRSDDEAYRDVAQRVERLRAMQQAGAPQGSPRA